MNYYRGRPHGSMRSSRERGDPRKYSTALWLRRGYGNTLVVAAVSARADQSGNGNNATAAAAGNRPTASGAPVTIVFDGSDDALEMDAVVAGGAFTAAMTYKLTTTPTAGEFFSPLSFCMSATKTFFELLIVNDAGYLPVSLGAKVGPINSVGFSPTHDTAAHRLVVSYDDGNPSLVGSYAIIYDGTSQTVVQSGALNRSTDDIGSVGARVTAAHATSFPLDGAMDEVVVIGGVISQSRLSRLDGYMKAVL